MKFFLSLFLMAFLGFATSLYLPWWSIAPVCFLVALLIPLRGGPAFLCGFLAMVLLWGGLCTWISVRNDHILAHRISELILKQDSPALIIIVTAFIGGITGGLSSLSGNLLRKNGKAF